MQNRRGWGFKLLPVSETYLNLPPNLIINLNELYDGGRFIEEPDLENLIRLHGNINYRLGENIRIKLMSISRSIILGAYRHVMPRYIMPKTERPGTFGWCPPLIFLLDWDWEVEGRPQEIKESACNISKNAKTSMYLFKIWHETKQKKLYHTKKRTTGWFWISKATVKKIKEHGFVKISAVDKLYVGSSLPWARQ